MYGTFCTHITPKARVSCNLYWGRKSSSTILNPNPKRNISTNNKKFPRLSTARRHMISPRKKNRTYVQSLLQSFGIAKVLFLWTRCLEGQLSILTDMLEHYQFCTIVFFELLQEEMCQKWWSSMTSPSHTIVSTSETVKKFLWKVLQCTSSSLDLTKEFEPHNCRDAATAIGQSPLLDISHTSITIVSTSVTLLPAVIKLTSFRSVNIWNFCFLT